jgi:hypothetical protein
MDVFWLRSVRETPLFAPVMHKNDHFTKTGSGQTGKTQKRVAFFLGCRTWERSEASH